MRTAYTTDLSVSPLAHVGGQEWQTQANVFDELYTLFLVLGTLVGIVVITYLLYKAYKYREGREVEDDEFEEPVLGELPVGAEKGGKKVFVSFAISAIIVVSLVAYAYTALLYVEAGPTEELGEEDVLEVDVTAFAFGWSFEYPNGETTNNELVVPEGKAIDLEVSSRDVWHTFSVRELRVKADAIPGQTASTWFIADETGEYRSVCDELCGSGHSQMYGTVNVTSQETFLNWYEDELDGDRDEVFDGEIDDVGGIQTPTDDDDVDEEAGDQDPEEEIQDEVDADDGDADGDGIAGEPGDEETDTETEDNETEEA